MPVVITGLEPGILLDSFTVTETGGGNLYYLPEESLDPLKGQNAQGTWMLEVWDNRVGATNGTPTLVDWNLDFTFSDRTNTPAVIQDGRPIHNSIGAGGVAYYLINVPTNASFATNLLLRADAPLNVWFTTDSPPSISGGNAYLLIPNATNGLSVLTLTSNPTNIVPGGTYYLGVQNTNSFTVDYDLEVDFDITIFPPVFPAPAQQTVNEGDAARRCEFGCERQHTADLHGFRSRRRCH